MRYLYKTPQLLKWYYPDLIWDFTTAEKCVYLTFDDGPTKEYTHWILEQLDTFNAKATFFCIGNNVEDCRDEFNSIIEKGHAVGNHTYSHMNGWNNSLLSYLRDVKKCEDTFSSKLFRPPHGRMSNKQSAALCKDYKVIMWDVLSGDFDTNLSGEDCAEAVLDNTTNGSIIVFHDSKKAWKRLKIALPIVLADLHARGFSFKLIES
jgi:peptidoglycan/xylan/chitin deacetylase (PgdA/CDA1 family)